MVRYVKRLWRRNPSGFEERHPILSHFLFIITLFSLGTTIFYSVHGLSHFLHEPHLWAIFAEGVVVLVHIGVYILVLLHRLSRWKTRPIPLRTLTDIELPTRGTSDPHWRYSIVDPGTIDAEKVVGGTSGLEPYARISESFAHILDANPELTSEARRKLYLKWYSYCPTAFMALEFRDWLGGWSVAAVSIVLPFTADGADDFVSGRTDIRRLDRRDFAPPGVAPSALLIDTLIISMRYQKWNWTGRRAFPGLTVRHVAAFWPSPPTEWRLLVEPDDPKLETKVLTRILGFQRCDEREGATLYVLSSTDAAQRQIFGRLAESLGTSLNWPLHVTGSGGDAAPPNIIT